MLLVEFVFQCVHMLGQCLDEFVVFGLGYQRLLNDRQKQIHHNESGKQDENNKEDPSIGKLLHHRPGHAVRPTIERHDLK